MRKRRWNKKLPPLRWKVSFAGEWRDDKYCFEFHNTSSLIVRVVFARMKSLYQECKVTTELMPDIVNGKCYRSIVATITSPDERLLSLDKWPMIIIHHMQDIYDCEVKYFKDYETFLNT